MQFGIYKRVSPSTWERQSDVTLSGKTSPFAKCVRDAFIGIAESVQWQIGEQELLGTLGISETEGHAVILDMKPSQKKRVLLGRIQNVQGLSSNDSTTI